MEINNQGPNIDPRVKGTVDTDTQGTDSVVGGKQPPPPNTADQVIISEDAQRELEKDKDMAQQRSVVGGKQPPPP